MTLPAIIRLAVLDDYANISPRYLEPLLTKNQQTEDQEKSPVPVLQISYYPETINITDTHSPTPLLALIDRLRPYTLISSMRERTVFPRSLLTQLPDLKVLFTTGMRNAGIDLQACRELGIVVVGTRARPFVLRETADGTGTERGFDTTNEQNWALILGLSKGVAEHDARLKEGSSPSSNSITTAGGEEDRHVSSDWQGTVSLGLAGKTLACLGLGKLGLQCALTGRLGFGMNVIAWSANLTQDKADEALQARGMAKGSVRVVGTKEELIRNADVLSLHVVLSDRTRGIMGREELALMKKTAILVNTARGPLVDEDALLEVLREGRIRGYAADVFDVEPLPRDSEWRNREWGKNGRSQVLLSPHMGYVEEDVLHGMYEQTAKNVEEYLAGKEFSNRIS